MKWNDQELFTMPRPQDPRHPPMQRRERAAQFAAFAALTGFEEQLAGMQQRITAHYNDPYR